MLVAVQFRVEMGQKSMSHCWQIMEMCIESTVDDAIVHD